MGMDSMVLVREAKPAARAAFGFSSSLASTKPITFCWLGQIMNQTLNAIIRPNHIAMPNKALVVLPSVSPVRFDSLETL